jgi:nitrile hydratase
MDGIHDMGGRQGFGAVLREADEPAFHERWEARVFALVGAAGACGALRNTDQFRHAIERMEPVAYLRHGYYGRWLAGVETLLRESGMVDESEITARVAALGGDPAEPSAARPAPRPDRIGYPPAAPGNRRAIDAAPRFAVGDAVRTAAYGVPGHTRLPGYARGRPGTVLRHHGSWVLPDSNAHGRGEDPRHLYTVEFSGEALWGERAEPGTSVTIDLFEPYLQADCAAALPEQRR